MYIYIFLLISLLSLSFCVCLLDFFSSRGLVFISTFMLLCHLWCAMLRKYVPLKHIKRVKLAWAICECERAHCQSTHFGRRSTYNSLPVAYLLRICQKVRVRVELELRVESWRELDREELEESWRVGRDWMERQLESYCEELAWSCFGSHTGYDLSGADKTPAPHESDVRWFQPTFAANFGGTKTSNCPNWGTFCSAMCNV